MLSGCAARSWVPLASLYISPSASSEEDFATIDTVATSVGLQPIALDPDSGREGNFRCLGPVRILAMYRVKEDVDIRVLRRLDSNRLSVTMSDSAARGAAFTADDRATFSQLIEKLRAAFGSTRVEVDRNWGDRIITCR
jgi:hypothetical protein